MDLDTRKIEFIKEFLKIQSEEVVSRLEKILKKEKNNLNTRVLQPMTQDDLEKRIDRSESDFRNNRFKSSSELLEKYE